jgi:hypothetical protein
VASTLPDARQFSAHNSVALHSVTSATLTPPSGVLLLFIVGGPGNSCPLWICGRFLSASIWTLVFFNHTTASFLILPHHNYHCRNYKSNIQAREDSYNVNQLIQCLMFKYTVKVSELCKAGISLANRIIKNMGLWAMTPCSVIDRYIPAFRRNVLPPCSGLNVLDPEDEQNMLLHTHPVHGVTCPTLTPIRTSNVTIFIIYFTVYILVNNET